MPSVRERERERERACVGVGCPTVRGRGMVYKATRNCSGKFCRYMVLSKFIRL